MKTRSPFSTFHCWRAPAYSLACRTRVSNGRYSASDPLRKVYPFCKDVSWPAVSIASTSVVHGAHIALAPVLLNQPNQVGYGSHIGDILIRQLDIEVFLQGDDQLHTAQ